MEVYTIYHGCNRMYACPPSVLNPVNIRTIVVACIYLAWVMMKMLVSRASPSGEKIGRVW